MQSRQKFPNYDGTSICYLLKYTQITAIFKCYFTCTFIHGQLLVHLYALLSCHAASVHVFYKSCFLWQINDDDDDDFVVGERDFETCWQCCNYRLLRVYRASLEPVDGRQ